MKKLWKAVYGHVGEGTGNRPPATGKGSSTGSPSPVTGSLNSAARDLRRLAHQTLTKVTDDLGRRRIFNTAIAAVMELMNALAKFDATSKHDRAVAQETLELIVLMLAPIVPHACHALWRALGHTDAVIDVPWPQPDPVALQQDSIELVVQVNGKLRGHITVAVSASEEEIKQAALADGNVKKWIEGKAIRRIIVVPGKLVNVVV